VTAGKHRHRQLPKTPYMKINVARDTFGAFTALCSVLGSSLWPPLQVQSSYFPNGRINVG
jgi:hypothetical protein